jgi:hypothetical protein
MARQNGAQTNPHIIDSIDQVIELDQKDISKNILSLKGS